MRPPLFGDILSALLNMEVSPEIAVSPGCHCKGTLPLLPWRCHLLQCAAAGVSACSSHMVSWVSRLTQMQVDEWELVAGKTETQG